MYYRFLKVKTANLLGIVGTDVPVEEIQKLVPPYKVRINAFFYQLFNAGCIKVLFFYNYSFLHNSYT